MGKDGGPAFPVPEVRDADLNGIMEGAPGMSLRDWFAGQALIGCLAYSHYNESWGDYHNNGSHADLAHKCYAQADAMLAAREASNG